MSFNRCERKSLRCIALNIIKSRLRSLELQLVNQFWYSGGIPQFLLRYGKESHLSEGGLKEKLLYKYIKKKQTKQMDTN